MPKVAIPFFCTQTKTSYKVGSEYKGKRTDLDAFMEGYKPVKENKKQPKAKLEKK